MVFPKRPWRKTKEDSVRRAPGGRVTVQTLYRCEITGQLVTCRLVATPNFCRRKQFLPADAPTFIHNRRRKQEDKASDALALIGSITHLCDIPPPA